jgi:hypothetical protein
LSDRRAAQCRPPSAPSANLCFATGACGAKRRPRWRLLRSPSVPARTRELADAVLDNRARLAARYAHQRDPSSKDHEAIKTLPRDLERSEAALARASGLFARQAAVLEAGLNGLLAGRAARSRPAALVEYRRRSATARIARGREWARRREARRGCHQYESDPRHRSRHGHRYRRFVEGLTNDAFVRRSLPNEAGFSRRERHRCGKRKSWHCCRGAFRSKAVRRCSLRCGRDPAALGFWAEDGDRKWQAGSCSKMLSKVPSPRSTGG